MVMFADVRRRGWGGFWFFNADKREWSNFYCIPEDALYGWLLTQ